ncbi:glycosyltransferase 87 family protein [Streptomyces sp. CC228A]|uniref:glycosyltransferase 87 family protein n=1 Tax=Streptomyces sp. CC228A TaxID=2898186 RepID=UPI001F484C54|nr:glycosyltransferase 87 family protein [Streptomyces sp. CC228A]
MTATAQTRLRGVPWAAAAACLLSFAGFWVAQRAAHVNLLDLSVYRAEAETVLAGGDLYAMRATSANLPTTYPPFAALLFTPLTLVGVPEMQVLAALGNLLLLVALAHLSLRLVRSGPPGRGGRVAALAARPGAALLLAAVVVWCEPVWQTFRYGQINLLITVAVLWDLTRREGSRWAGVGIGLATAVKLTPGLFVAFLVLAGVARARGGGRAEWWNPWLRQAVRATGAFLVVTVASHLVLPYDSRRFWTEMIFETSRVGRTEETANQSLSGVVARLLHTTDPGVWWIAAAVPVAVLGLAVAVRAALRGDRPVAVVACATTGLLVSPISWSHHWVWCVPMLVLLAVRARPVWAVAAALVFASNALWWVPHAPAPVRLELHQTPGQMLLSALYTLLGTGLLAALAARRRGRRPGGANGPHADAGSPRSVGSVPHAVPGGPQAVAKE